MKKAVLLAFIAASLVLRPVAAHAAFQPAEEQLLTIVSVLPALGTVLEHQGAALIVGKSDIAGTVVSFIHSEDGPLWILDEWIPIAERQFRVVHWQFTYKDTKRSIHIRRILEINERGASLETIEELRVVKCSKEADEKSRLAWKILCESFPCRAEQVPSGP